MSNTNTGGPAFPTGTWEYDGQNNVLPYQESGMTLREYAAIKLRVPDSGTEWLDKMIVKSLRDEFAAKAMQALVQRRGGSVLGSREKDDVAEEAFILADAMLRARDVV